MRHKRNRFTVAAIGGVAALAISATAVAQMGPMRGDGHGQNAGQGRMMEMMAGHMQEHMAQHDMMGPMAGGMHGWSPGRMGPHMRGGRGMGRQFGLRVLPRMNLSVDDVRTHFEQMLGALGNDRLKVGPVKEKDMDTITAQIVTVDDSLVQSLDVDRRTGMIGYGK